MNQSTLFKVFAPFIAATALAFAPGSAWAQHGGGGHGGGGGFHGGGGFRGSSGAFRGGGTGAMSRGSGIVSAGGSGYRGGMAAGARSAPQSGSRFAGGGSYRPPANGMRAMGAAGRPAAGASMSARPGNAAAVADGQWHSFGGDAAAASRMAKSGSNGPVSSGTASAGPVRSFSGQGHDIVENTPRAATNAVTMSGVTAAANAGGLRLGSGFGRGTGSSFAMNSANGSVNRFGFHGPGFAGSGFRPFRPFGGGNFGNGFLLRRPFVPGFGFGCCGGLGFGLGWGFGFGWPGFWPAFYDPFWYDDLWGWPAYAPGYGYPGVYYDPNAYYDPSYDLPIYGPNSNTPDVGAPDTGAPPAMAPNSNGANGNWDTSLNAPKNGANGGPSAGQAVTLYFKDGTQFAASDYWFADDKLHYIGNDGSEKTSDLADLDMQRTIDENGRAGVKFWLKSSPNSPKAAPAAPDGQKTPTNGATPARASSGNRCAMETACSAPA